ncbi:hypothetical protein CEP51_009178, partial [Fusarium floridanum]
MFPGYPTTNKTVPQLIEGCQEFQEALTDLKDWSEADTADLAWLYVIQLLSIQGFKVSMNDFLRDPIRVLEIIYCKLQWESVKKDDECSPETPPSSTDGRDADELPLLCSDTESLTNGEEDDTASNSNVDTDDHMNDDDCYRLLGLLNDRSRHLTLRVFGLWVRSQELQAEEGRIRRAERVLCAWRTFANLVFSSRLYGAIDIIELQLPQAPF